MKTKLSNKSRKCKKCDKTFYSPIWQKIHCNDCISAPTKCVYCGKIFLTPEINRKFCSMNCTAMFKKGKKRSIDIGKKIKEGQERYKNNNIQEYRQRYNRHSEYMKKNNPMFVKENINKMMVTKKNNGTLNIFPVERGGNGKLTIPQKLLSNLLGQNWTNELAIPTKIKKGNGYPTCYKIDIGRKDLKIGIEIDGSSHNSKRRKNLDRKKDAFLDSIGWNMLRFKNEAVIDDPEGIKRIICSYVKFIKNIKRDIRSR